MKKKKGPKSKDARNVSAFNEGQGGGARGINK